MIDIAHFIKKNTRQIGTDSEKIAINFLKDKKYKIIITNFCSIYGEIDIITISPQNNTLCFIEVRSKNKDSLIDPILTINKKKIEKIKKTALYFLKTKGKKYQSIPARFDVITIKFDINNQIIHHYENAFN